MKLTELKSLIALVENGVIPETKIESTILDELYRVHQLNLMTLFLQIQDRHAKKQDELIGNLKNGLHYGVCALKYKYKKIPAKDLPLLFPIMLAHFANGTAGYSIAEIKFFEKFKESYLENRSDFTDDWLKNYGYDVITDQFR